MRKRALLPNISRFVIIANVENNKQTKEKNNYADAKQQAA